MRERRLARLTRATALATIGLSVRVALAGYETPNSIYTVASDSPNYYNSANGQTGAALKATLQTIISAGFTKREYGESRYAESLLDQDPSNPLNVLEIYNRASVPGTWDATSSNWTREHQWPASLLPSGTPQNPNKTEATDLFELRPINQTINGIRGNSTYGTPTSTGGTYSGNVSSPFGYNASGTYWYPGVADTGDVARAMFYMATRYAGGTTNLTLVNGDTSAVGQMGDLASLLRWNYTDPVDNFERRRNHLIYTSDTGVNGWQTTGRPAPFNVAPYDVAYTQGNRNPYIDHPEYVWSVFGGGNNNSQISVATPAGNGSSSATVNLRVMKNAAWGTGNATITKTGSTPTTYDLTATANVSAAANTFGPGQAFDFNGQSRVIAVGLTDSTTTTGLTTGTVTIDNTDLTSAGAGLASADGNDTINVVGQVVDNRSINATAANFGRVIIGSAVTTGTTLSSSGDDDHFTRVVVKANASSTDGNGAFIASASDVTFNGTVTSSSRTVQANFSSTGSKGNTLSFTVQNGETAISGTPTIAPVSVTYSATAVDHAQPSLSSGVSVTTQGADFGYVPAGFAPRTLSFSVFNNASPSGAPLTAGLDVDGVTRTGSSLMSTDVIATNPGTPLAANGSLNYTVTFMPDTIAGAASADHTIAVSDENIPGNAARPDLVLTSTGRTFTAATFPVTGYLNLLPGETLNTGAFFIQPGVTLTRNGSGIMNIDAAQSNGAASQLVLADGVTNVDTDFGSAAAANLALTASTGATVTLNATQHLAALNINSTTVTVATPVSAARVISTPLPTITGSGQLDLTANKMVVRGGGPDSWNGSHYTGVTGQVQDGRNGGSWSGAGIVTTMSDAQGATGLTTLAVAAASDVLGIALGDTASWSGETVSGSDMLVKYTYAGDADLSGAINADDYFQIDRHVGDAVPSYFRGDFNYDGQINGDDYYLIDSNFVQQTTPFNASLPGGVSSVPEPAGALVIALASAATLRRRRRR